MKNKNDIKTKSKVKINKELYCQFLLGAQNNFTMTAMADLSGGLTHDKINRWASETKLTPRILWKYTEPLITKNKDDGYVIVDDTIIEKDRGKEIALTSTHFSSSDKKYVNGINLTSLIWNNGKSSIPFDYRVYAPAVDGKTKNDHFREMLSNCHKKGFNPKAVLMDSWYSGVDNLKAIDSFGWTWITELKKNRIINHNEKLENINIPKEGLKVHLRAYGFVKIIKRVVTDNHLGYLATNNIDFSADDISNGYARRCKIEEYHRALKQITGIEECQARIGRIQKNHIFCSILAFIALEAKRLKDGISWYQSKYQIVKNAIKTYLKSPTIKLDSA